jgi:hypothetical protein
MSYPDLIEENGRYWFVETQKYFARVHEVPASFLQDLWTQSEQSTLTREGMVAEVDQETIRRGKVETGDLSFQKTADAGFTLDFILDSSKLIAGELFFDARNEEGNGWWIDVAQDKTLQLTLKNDHGSMTWDTDPGLLSDGESHHVTAIVDANPKVILFVVDGRVCDGGEHRYFGWRSAAGLPTINEAVVGRNAIDGEWDFRLPMMPSPSSDCHSIRLGAGAREAVRSLRVYRRYLWVTEAISNYRSLP